VPDLGAHTALLAPDLATAGATTIGHEKTPWLEIGAPLETQKKPEL